jgi:uncharacterized protein (TIGR00725 family)
VGQPLTTRLPIVGVLGSGTEPHSERAAAVGEWLATLDVHLLTGGGFGVMEQVCRAFHLAPGRRGLVIGVLPAGEEEGTNEPKEGYPNPWVEIPILTHLPLSGGSGTEVLSRNHINVLSAKVLIALPGAHGTSSEVELALRYGRPLVAYLDSRTQIENLSPDVLVEPDLEKVKEFVRSHLPGK